METEFSEQFYEKYFNSSNRNVEITLRSERIVKGVICGFYRNDEEHIIKWHIVDVQDGLVLGSDAFGYSTGEIIQLEDIQHVAF